MKRHGYKGAGDIAKRVGTVYGWEASTGEVDDRIFDEIAKTFVLDPENRAFFKEANPFALEEIGRRLLEAECRGGLWNRIQRFPKGSGMRTSKPRGGGLKIALMERTARYRAVRSPS